MNVLITSTADAFGQKLEEIFIREGYAVFTPENCPLSEPLDYLLDVTDYATPADNFTITMGINATVMEAVYRQNVIAPMATLEKFLPQLDQGQGKRLFYITSAKASINESQDITGYAYNMSKAGLHQFLQLVSNKLSEKGYTFRVFDPLDKSQAAAEAAYHYITRRRGTENFDIRRDDENNLIIRDAQGRQHGW